MQDLTERAVVRALHQTRAAGHRYAVVPLEALAVLGVDDLGARAEFSALVREADPATCGATFRQADCCLACLLPGDHPQFHHGFTERVYLTRFGPRPSVGTAVFVAAGGGAPYYLRQVRAGEFLRLQANPVDRVIRRSSHAVATAAHGGDEWAGYLASLAVPVRL